MRLIPWRRAWIVAALLIAASCRGGEVPAGAPAVQAGSAILVDADTGAVLFSQNAHQRRPMASTTKIMTAILILEYGHLDQVATVSERASQAGQSSVWLQPGERVTLGDLLKGILIKSGNDAAVAAAECVAGSEQAFVEKMNARARALGAGDTHFVNPHGLYAPDHYSTAADLALLARRAMRDPTFRGIVGSKTDVMANALAPADRLLTNHNKLLWRMPDCDGIKTGYVKESGRCLVFSATHRGWRLIGVLLDSPALWEEAQALLEYGFADYRQVCFARAGQRLDDAPVRWGKARAVPVVAAQSLSMVVPAGSTDAFRSEARLPRGIAAPVRRGQVLGRMEMLRDGKPVRSVRLVAGAAVAMAGWAVALVWLLRAAGVLLVGAVIFRTGCKFSRRRRVPV